MTQQSCDNMSSTLKIIMAYTLIDINDEAIHTG